MRNRASAARCGTYAVAKYDARWRADAGTLARVRVVITEIAWDGSIRRRALDTSRLTNPGRSGDWPAEALTLAASTSPGLVIADLGPPDAGPAAVALPAGLTAAFAATGVTHRLSPPRRHR
jgi:hypothetical protein